ncbi:udp-n-acetylglucosamine transferase subunit alg13 [Lasallia pustulata]|uniref:UDP-N-acetylglucosamine transferase subunit ALG13 n=1 Tax=Lasallia pustulata TaxID=136370 RepID=A0A1W5CZG9_9LECA|nr:udp-n-acetylglucosamine transferase subunit alg13 [Lasallia pustulata]
MSVENVRAKRLCFVTIGATASFDALIKEALSDPFLEALRDAGFSDLLLQHGKEGGKIFEDFRRRNATASERVCGVSIEGFDSNKAGLGQEMRAVKGENGTAEGVVISHAGSGSILDALRIAVPLIVVPNPDLLDNHQVELAEELSNQGYVVHGRLSDLPSAIRQSEANRAFQKSWPPVNSGEDPSGRGLAGVMDDEMGFVD